MDTINIKGPEEYKLYFHTSMEGDVWHDGKGKPTPLDQPLVNHVDSISPQELWNSRSIRTSIHSKDNPHTGRGYNSTAVDKDTPNFNTPLAPQLRLQSICLSQMGSALRTHLSKTSWLTLTFPQI